MGHKTIKERLIPYSSKEELSQRVGSLFEWDYTGDPFPKNYSNNPELPQGVLVSYWKESWHFTYFPREEFYDLIAVNKHLPENHEIIQEILKHAKRNLEEILTKSSNELKIRTPKYLNSFRVGDLGGYERIYPDIKNAADYVFKLEIKTDEDPPKEADILWSAVKGMLGYDESHSQEVESFLDNLWDKKLVLPFIITGYADLNNDKAIRIYFELFRLTKGKDDFLLNGIQRGVGFKFLGKRLKRIFPNYNFSKNIKLFEDSKLKNKLYEIFASS